ncbi:MAG: hypothetical protein CM1200mP30_01720 [Pseudomonadota bacterium]|nr:MAG: hypothetical protein CM1200mP30_01720 [Pseudomonadota bacterium]
MDTLSLRRDLRTELEIVLRFLSVHKPPYMDQSEVAQVLGIDKDRVRIIPSAVGGGFGGKLDMSVQPLVPGCCVDSESSRKMRIHPTGITFFHHKKTSCEDSSKSGLQQRR